MRSMILGGCLMLGAFWIGCGDGGGSATGDAAQNVSASQPLDVVGVWESPMAPGPFGPPPGDTPASPHDFEWVHVHPDGTYIAEVTLLPPSKCELENFLEHQSCPHNESGRWTKAPDGTLTFTPTTGAPRVYDASSRELVEPGPFDTETHTTVLSLVSKTKQTTESLNLNAIASQPCLTATCEKGTHCEMKDFKTVSCVPDAR